jgi:hypothetical protein
VGRSTAQAGAGDGQCDEARDRGRYDAPGHDRSHKGDGPAHGGTDQPPEWYVESGRDLSEVRHWVCVYPLSALCQPYVGRAGPRQSVRKPIDERTGHHCPQANA